MAGPTIEPSREAAIEKMYEAGLSNLLGQAPDFATHEAVRAWAEAKVAEYVRRGRIVIREEARHA